MTLYELRTYTLQVGKMGEGAKLFQEIGMPLITKRGWGRSAPPTDQDGASCRLRSSML